MKKEKVCNLLVKNNFQTNNKEKKLLKILLKAKWTIMLEAGELLYKDKFIHLRSIFYSLFNYAKIN